MFGLRPFFLLFIFSFGFSFQNLSHAAAVPFKLALGSTYIGGQIHWGFARKWALELRSLKDEQTGAEGTVKASVVGVRGYHYFRPPQRVRFFMGLEAASTKSRSNLYNFQTDGYALGGFAGTELYLLRRLSVGVDVGPYFLSSKTSRTPGAQNDGDMSFVINTFMNFYFL